MKTIEIEKSSTGIFTVVLVRRWENGMEERRQIGRNYYSLFTATEAAFPLLEEIKLDALKPISHLMDEWHFEMSFPIAQEPQYL